jgi:hypothetical protein
VLLKMIWKRCCCLTKRNTDKEGRTRTVARCVGNLVGGGHELVSEKKGRRARTSGALTERSMEKQKSVKMLNDAG